MTDFEAALKVLTDGGVRFIVVGAYAAVAHGSSQVTRDLDICYERTAEKAQTGFSPCPVSPAAPGH